jgi:hypothetical protein
MMSNGTNSNVEVMDTSLPQILGQRKPPDKSGEMRLDQEANVYPSDEDDSDELSRREMGKRARMSSLSANNEASAPLEEKSSEAEGFKTVQNKKHRSHPDYQADPTEVEACDDKPVSKKRNPRILIIEFNEALSGMEKLARIRKTIDDHSQVRNYSLKLLERGAVSVLFMTEKQKTSIEKIINTHLKGLKRKGFLNNKKSFEVILNFWPKTLDADLLLSIVPGLTATKPIREGRSLILYMLTIDHAKDVITNGIFIGNYFLRADIWVSSPKLLCQRCQKLGHSESSCTEALTCGKCGSFHEPTDDCTAEISCTLCNANHGVLACPEYLKSRKEARDRKKATYREAVLNSGTHTSTEESKAPPVLPVHKSTTSAPNDERGKTTHIPAVPNVPLIKSVLDILDQMGLLKHNLSFDEVLARLTTELTIFKHPEKPSSSKTSATNNSSTNPFSSSSGTLKTKSLLLSKKAATISSGNSKYLVLTPHPKPSKISTNISGSNAGLNSSTKSGAKSSSSSSVSPKVVETSQGNDNYASGRSKHVPTFPIRLLSPINSPTQSAEQTSPATVLPMTQSSTICNNSQAASSRCLRSRSHSKTRSHDL